MNSARAGLRSVLFHPFTLLTAAAFAAFLPFINRPLFVDDHAVFGEALRLGRHLLRPYASDPASLGWTHGRQPGENNPFAYFYLVYALSRFLGAAEWKFHLAFIPIQAAGLCAFYSLAKRFTRYPLWAALLWLSSSHFWITGNALLVDTLLGPTMIVGVALWVDGWESERAGRLWLGAFFLGLAPLIKYTGVLGWAAAAGWSALHPSRGRRWSYFLLPAAMMAGWLAWSKLAYGEAHMGAVARSSVVFPSINQLIELLCFSSGVTPALVLPLALTAWPRSRAPRRTAAIAFAAAVLCGLLMFPRAAVGLQMGFWLGATLIWFLWTPPLEGENRRDNLFLLLWVGLGLAGFWIARPWICARYFVVIGPAFILVTLRSLERRAPAALGSTCFRAAALMIFTLLSGTLAAADYQHAQIDKRLAAALVTWAQREPPGTPLYYPATLLPALSYYLEGSGWRPLDPQVPTKQGDIVIIPLRTLPRALQPAIVRARLLHRFTFGSHLPLRTLDSLTFAGFYGSIWGPLPFSWSRGPLDDYALIEVAN